MNVYQQFKIIIADDEPQNLRYLFNALDAEKYRVYIAPDGETVFNQAVKLIPDAIIMDWDMPKMDGIEAVKQIRATEGIKNIPVIMATGKMISTENLKTALDAGANDYIRKPFDTLEIIARVKSMIRLNVEYKKNIELQKHIAGQKIADLKSELERNTSYLTAAKLRLIEHGQNTLLLIGDLQNLREHVSEAGDKIITNIISYTKTNSLRVNWVEFEMLFGKVHSSFYDRLQQLFPRLTKNERKLCALIKLNLDTKEISAITGRKNDTVKKAKHRLKYKLGIDSMESLYSFLQEIN